MTTPAKLIESTKLAPAEAGRRGPDVRSDCWVRYAPGGGAGIEITLRSRVERLYGDSIRALAVETLRRLGVGQGLLDIEDAGALPWVIMARLEAAVLRAGAIASGDASQSGAPSRQALPDWTPGAQRPTNRERFRRSRLYLPGNEPKFMLNAGLHEPDGVILDLEDSVAPAEKDAARVLVRNALRSVDFGNAERMVRINQGDLGLADLDWIVPHNVHVVLIPKVEDPAQVQAVERRIATVCGCEQAPMLMPIIESARGALRAFEIATASPSIVALTIGLEDYTADIGAARTAEGRESFWARCQVVNAARAAGVQPIDSVFSDVADLDGLRAGVREARGLGFEGKGCIHPRQIRVIHEAFAPTPEELEKARRIVAAFEDAQARGLAAVSLGSKMIDPPVVKRAQKLVELAERLA